MEVSEVRGESMQLDHMSDEEILEGILESYEEDGRLNMNYIDIEVADKSVTINGRVTSEDELQIINEIMREILGVQEYSNKVWVDDTLTYEDPDDNSPNLKGLNLDDDEIDDQDYSEEEDEEEYY